MSRVLKFSFATIGEGTFSRGALNWDMTSECDRFFMNNNPFCDSRTVTMGLHIVTCTTQFIHFMSTSSKKRLYEEADSIIHSSNQSSLYQCVYHFCNGRETISKRGGY